MKVPERKVTKGNSCIDDDPDATELDASIIDGYTAGRLLARCHSREERQSAAQAIVEAVAAKGVRRTKPKASTGAC